MASKIDNENVGQVREYIGSRYVPIFANPPEWDNQREYEPLTIVLHGGNSYTSAQYVPTGIEITNTAYWMLTGNFNAQVEQYRQGVADLEGDVADFEAGINAKFPIATADIADNAVTQDKLATDSVDTDNILNASVTPEKLSDEYAPKMHAVEFSDENPYPYGIASPTQYGHILFSNAAIRPNQTDDGIAPSQTAVLNFVQALFKQNHVAPYWQPDSNDFAILDVPYSSMVSPILIDTTAHIKIAFCRLGQLVFAFVHTENNAYITRTRNGSNQCEFKVAIPDRFKPNTLLSSGTETMGLNGMLFPLMVFPYFNQLSNQQSASGDYLPYQPCVNVNSLNNQLEFTLPGKVDAISAVIVYPGPNN